MSLDRLNQAIEHVEWHLTDEVDVRELARIALTSEHHLRRMFSVLAGMPLGEYVRRRRLTVAGAAVLAGEETLLDVATRFGYASGEAFARAFRGLHGIGPGEARRTGAALVTQPRLSFRLVVEGSSEMRYRIVHKDSFHLVGRRARVPLVHEGLNPAIVSFVRSLPPATVRRIEALADQEPHGVVNVSHDVDQSRAEGTELDYWYAAVSGAAVPEDLDALPVTAGDWAVFDSEGAFPEAVQHLWRDVFTLWFPSQPWRSRPGPEMLRSRVSEDGTRADAQLWIPVERELGVQ